MQSTRLAVARYELPEAIAQFAGLINDTDGHQAMPVRRWEDIRVESEVQAMLERAVACFGDLDVLVNNAGVGIGKTA